MYQSLRQVNMPNREQLFSYMKLPRKLFTLLACGTTATGSDTSELTTSAINVSFKVQNSGYIKVDLTLRSSEHKTPSSTETGSTGTPLTFSVNIYIQHLGVHIMQILP